MKTLEIIGLIGFLVSLVAFWSLGSILFVFSALACFIVSVVAHNKAQLKRFRELGIR